MTGEGDLAMLLISPFSKSMFNIFVHIEGGVVDAVAGGVHEMLLTRPPHLRAQRQGQVLQVCVQHGRLRHLDGLFLRES